MPSPPPWPQPHPYAEDFDLFWLVRQVPPEPFPTEGYDYGADIRFGPPGTRWVFTLEALYNRMSAVGVAQGTKLAIERLFQKLAIKLPPAGSTSWTTPEPLTEPNPNPLEVEPHVAQVVRTQIVQAVGTTEQAVHVLHWAPIGADAPAMDAAALKTFGDRVRDNWETFLLANFRGQPGGGGSFGPFGRYMAPQARYTEIRTSLVGQAGPGDWTEYGPGTNQTEHPGADPKQIGQTVLSPVNPVTGAALTTNQLNALPYEVACCVGLNTNFRGPRFRGRVYLGPLNVGVMAANGMFIPDFALDAALRFGEFLDRVNTGQDLKAVVYSQKFATWAPIQGTRAGVVPDSQRRRRRGQVENYVQAWGTPIGGAS